MDIYGYDDFRAYVADRYKEKKTSRSDYSYRMFAREAGFSNPGFLNDVIKSRRQLSKSATEKMITVFNLSPAEAEFFRLLVEYARAKKIEKKEAIYRRIQFRRNRSSFARVNPAVGKYYQDYRYALIRTALLTTEFYGDYDELYRFIRPQIPSHHIRKIIRDLCDWGLVSQDPTGKYIVHDTLLEPPETLKETIRQLHYQWIDQAKEALMMLPASKRHISSMLFGISTDACRIITEKIERFREELWEVVKEDTKDPSCIMQLNIHFFPQSKNRERL